MQNTLFYKRLMLIFFLLEVIEMINKGLVLF